MNAGRAAHGTRRTSKPQQRRDDDRERKPGNAFITARKGFCYLTIKSFGRNHEMMRIRQYQIDAEEKRRMRRLYPDVAFDWTKITAQLAQKRDACRRYRARRRGRDKASHSRGSDAFHGVYDPATRTIYASRIPSARRRSPASRGSETGIGPNPDAQHLSVSTWHHHAEVSLPLYPDARTRIIANLQIIAAGGRASLIAVGTFTEPQFNDLNAVRRGLGLHAIESREIVFIGRHIYVSRSKDGYTIDDMVLQIESALSAASVVFANPKMTAMNNPHPRADGYGNRVYDRAIFECTQRKPRAELFSVIPKGDDQKPQTKKARPSASLSEDDPG